ncbi:MAG: type IV pilus biogenesis/stability protein PilW [Gammaproteobacteria bacterium]|nr:type IV pilus biogenesis/stability protein PilW [Gammaproteobacteria bacterium]
MMKRYGSIAVVCLSIALGGCNQTNVRSDGDKQSPAEANVELGVLYMQQGQKVIAMEVLQKALTQDPNSADAHTAIAVLYASLGETDKADDHFRRSLSLDAKNPQTRNSYGSFLCEQKQWDDAEKQYLTAANNPLYDSPQLSYTNAGICASRAQNLAKAEQYWRKALEISPKYPPALLQMARLNVNQKNYMSARAYLQRFHEVARPTPESLWLGIQTERVLGDKNAEASYSMLLKNGFPDSPQAKQLLGQ